MERCVFPASVPTYICAHISDAQEGLTSFCCLAAPLFVPHIYLYRCAATHCRRLTIHDIQHHPWFLNNLPPDVVSMNEAYMQNTDFTGVQVGLGSMHGISGSFLLVKLKFCFGGVPKYAYSNPVHSVAHVPFSRHLCLFSVLCVALRPVSDPGVPCRVYMLVR